MYGIKYLQHKSKLNAQFRVRDRGGILLFSAFSREIKDIAKSPAARCAAKQAQRDATPKNQFHKIPTFAQ